MHSEDFRGKGFVLLRNGALFQCLHVFCVTPCAGTTVQHRRRRGDGPGAKGASPSGSRRSARKEVVGRSVSVLLLLPPVGLGPARKLPAFQWPLRPHGACARGSGPWWWVPDTRLPRGVCFRVTDGSLSCIFNLLRREEQKDGLSLALREGHVPHSGAAF